MLTKIKSHCTVICGLDRSCEKHDESMRIAVHWNPNTVISGI